MKHAAVRLKPKEDGRIAAGHCWVFSNEIAQVTGDPQVGDVVEVKSSREKSLGFGFYNPKTLISVRMFTKEFREPDKTFFVDRIKDALGIRDRLFNVPYYRLVYGESDFLPGLIIDRFNGLFSIQVSSAAMEKRMPFILDALHELFSPAAIYERNESPTRELEGLPQTRSIIHGVEQTADYDEEGVVFRINPFRGQKTGFYFDQRLNRIFSRRFARGARVLDLFSNEGGFALNLAHHGAESVLAVESSQQATSALRINSELNGLKNVSVETGDVNEFMSSAASSGGTFDVVVCDPPSFTHNRKSVTAAKVAYRRLHEKIFGLLVKNGTLLTSSCSHHVYRETFEEIVNDAALRCGRTLQLLHRAGAAPDHPVLPSMPETEYLKFDAYEVR